VFIGVNAHMCMSICLYTAFKKKSFTGNETSSIEIYLPIDSLG
jgi:hypothetical protein